MGMSAVTYTDDGGNDHTVLIDDVYIAQAGLGWVASTDTENVRKFDGGFKPRVALVRASSGETRRLPCGTNTATLYTTAGQACTVYHRRSSLQITAVSYGHEGERIRFIRPDAPAP